MTRQEETSDTSTPTPAFAKRGITGPEGKHDPAVKHLKAPYSMTLEEEKALLEEARRRLKLLLEKNCSEDGWYNRMNYKGVHVTSARDPDGGPFCMTKGVTEMPEDMTMEFIKQQYRHDVRDSVGIDQFFRRVDPMTKVVVTVSKIQNRHLLDESKHEEVSIVYGHFAVAPLVSDRDFCFVGHDVETTDPTTGAQIFVSNCFSIDHPAVPAMYETEGIVRAHIECTGYLFRPLPDDPSRLSMTYTLQADPKGYLPASIVNLVSVSQAMNVGRVRDMYAANLEAAKQMGVNAPLERYDISRRGGSVVHSMVVQKTTRRKTVLNEKEETSESEEVVEEEKKDETDPDTMTFFEIHVRAYAEHPISVKLLTSSCGELPYKLRCVNTNGDNSFQGPDLLEGKAVSFGGKNNHVFSATLEVLSNDESAIPDELQFEFVNGSWRKTTIYIPAGSNQLKLTGNEPADAAQRIEEQ